MKILLSSIQHSLSEEEIEYIANHTNGYTGADLRLLITESSLKALQTLESKNLSLSFDTIKQEIQHIRPSALREVAVTIPNVLELVFVHRRFIGPISVV